MRSAEKDNIIRDRTYQFALRIIELVRKLPRGTLGFVIGNQLLGSGTSIGANVEEAIGAFSRDDFIYKMNTALKEARESNYWLRLIRDSKLISTELMGHIVEESEEIKRILGSIVKTSKES